MANAILYRVLEDIKTLQSEELRLVEQAVLTQLSRPENGASAISKANDKMPGASMGIDVKGESPGRAQVGASGSSAGIGIGFEVKGESGASSASSADSNAWEVLKELMGTVVAPADWAAEHDHYLAGAPKRQPDTNL
jgi:hypothetical protein